MKENEQKRNEQTKGREVVGLVCLFLFLLIAAIFSALMVAYCQEGWVVNIRPWLFAAVCVLATALLVIGVAFWWKDKISWFRTTISLAFILAFFSSLNFVLIKSGFLGILRDPEEYKKFLENAGGWMASIYILLQYLQVVVLPIPSLISTMAGVALFGSHLALLYSLTGIILGSLTAFFIGRKLGYKAVAWIIGEDDLRKWRKKLKGKDNLLLTAMFLLPLFPDDVLCFVAGLSSMSAKFFVVMMLICRTIGIATTCYSLQILPFNTWWGILGWIAVYAVVIVGFVLFYKNIDRVNIWLSKIKKEK